MQKLKKKEAQRAIKVKEAEEEKIRRRDEKAARKQAAQEDF